MCAIAGILRPSAPDSLGGEVERMTLSLAHRGPDGTGQSINRGVALGHRRLAIIDLAGSAQPMLTDDGRLALTYNGEIYNYRELRSELEAKGHRFRSSGDTEVILHAYREWGSDCPARLRGMFAFAVHDRDARTVFLCRDHFGIKPLYYRRSRELFAFASEIGALLEIDAPHPTGRRDAIDAYLRYQFIPEPATIYKEIHALPKGCSMLIDETAVGSGQPVSYWQPSFEPQTDQGRSLEDYVEEFEAALEESVQAHMVADVPFASFLSGGVDSTLVTGAMVRAKADARAYCLDLPNADASELQFAQQAANEMGCELLADMASGTFLETLEELLPRFGQPFGDSSMVPTLQVSRLARANVPMVLSGDGGDEGFGGYFWHEAWGHQSLSAFARRALNSPRTHTGQVMRFLAQAAKDRSGHRFKRWRSLALGLPDSDLEQLWREGRQPGREEIDKDLRAASARHAHLPATSFAQAMDFEGYLPSNILRKTDVASMACGLEVRTPFVDIRLFELIAKLPERHKLRRHIDGRSDRKIVPRASLRRRFPDSFVDRDKRGFGMPLESLLGGSAKEEIDFLFEASDSPLRQHFDLDANGGSATRTPTTNWLLFVLGKWLSSQAEVDFA